LSTFQNHITLPTAQERCIFWAWWRDWVFATVFALTTVVVILW